MDRTEKWGFLVEQLQENALKDIHATREYELRKIRQERLDDMLSNELTAGQRGFIEEIISETISFHDREADFFTGGA